MATERKISTLNERRSACEAEIESMVRQHILLFACQDRLSERVHHLEQSRHESSKGQSVDSDDSLRTDSEDSLRTSELLDLSLN
uniref:Uncharacterized protein n=1 Tax=Parascaris univalens TaxID=6257 RepID=A0A915B0V4_PARUN